MLLVSPNERQAILILRMRDLKYRESKQFVQDHIAAKWQNHDSNPQSDCRVHTFRLHAPVKLLLG